MAKTAKNDPNEMVTVTALSGVRHLERGEVGQMPRKTAERYSDGGWVAIHLDADEAAQEPAGAAGAGSGASGSDGAPAAGNGPQGGDDGKGGDAS